MELPEWMGETVLTAKMAHKVQLVQEAHKVTKGLGVKMEPMDLTVSVKTVITVIVASQTNLEKR